MNAFVISPSLSTSFNGTPVSSRCVQRKHTLVITCVSTGKKAAVQPKEEGGDNTGAISYASSYYRAIQDEDPEKLPPGPPLHRSVPLVGYILEHMLGLSTPRTRAKRYGGIYRSNFFIEDFVYIADMKATSDILKDTVNFTSVVPGQLATFFGDNSILFLDGPRHSDLRKVLAPAFSPSMFKHYFDGILSATEAMWMKVSADVSNNGNVLLDPVLRQHYIGIIIQVSSGIDANSDTTARLGKLFTEAVAGIVGPEFGPLWNRTVRNREEIAATLRKVITDKLVNEADIIESLRLVTDTESSMLSVKNVLKKGMDITQVAIAQTDLPTGKIPGADCATVSSLVDLLLLVWGAGFFTSAATTSCATFEGGMNPEILKVLVDEQDGLVKEKYGGDKKVTYEQICGEDMPLLDSYMMEILRLFPAGSGMLRTVKKDVVILDKTVKAGSVLFMDLIASLADENLYEDGEAIKVDRFIKEKNAVKPIAFGGPKSPHYCIGAALAKVLIKTNLCVMLRNYDLVLDPKQSRKYRLIPDYTPSSEVVVKRLDRRV